MRKKRRFTTTRMIMVGFLIGIIIGTFLLMLPISSRTGEWTSLEDALFMATSSICVTGLATLTPVVHFSVFGQVVMLLLIEFGGLGIVTFSTVFLMFVGRRITLTERMLIQDAYNLDTLSGLVRLTRKIVKGTLFVELVGALCYMTVFWPDYGFLKGLWFSVFHSVSAFCNAGLDLLGADSLISYQGNATINIVTMLLIIIGGIGFPVWWEIVRVFKMCRKWHFRRLPWKEFNVHTKVVLFMTGLLIVLGAVLVYIFEFNNPDTLGPMSIGNRIMAATFQSVTFRTAGFATVAQGSLQHVTCLLGIILMFIGGSPSGTAGGIKTVTFAIIIASTMSIIKGKGETAMFHRRVTENALRKALAVILVSFSLLIVLTMALMFVQKGDFLDTMYEMTSAIATVGLSRGMTGELQTAGKLIVVLTMYLGRIGPISLALALNARPKERKTTEAEGKLIVG